MALRRHVHLPYASTITTQLLSDRFWHFEKDLSCRRFLDDLPELGERVAGVRDRALPPPPPGQQRLL